MILLLAYLGGYALAVVPITMFVVRDFKSISGRIDAVDLAFGCFFGAMLSLGWPLLIPGFWLYRTVKSILDQEEEAK